MVVHRTVNATVAGSSPATQANYGHGIKVVPWIPNPEMSGSSPAVRAISQADFTLMDPEIWTAVLT